MKKLLKVVMSLMLTLAIVPSFVFATDDDTEDTPTYVASIGDTNYETLSEAVSSASDDDTVTLLADVSLDSKLTITNDITLDLDEKTISASSSFTDSILIYINNGTDGKVTIKDGTVTGSSTYLISIGAGVLNLSNLTIDGENSSNQVGIYLTGNSSTLNSVDSCTIKDVYDGIKTYKCNPSGNTTAGIISISNTTINATGHGIYLVKTLCQSIDNSDITGGTNGILLESNYGDKEGYRTEVTIKNSTITGTNSYGLYLYDKYFWTGGNGTLKADLTGCDLYGNKEGNNNKEAVWIHDYMANDGYMGNDFSFTYTDCNLVCVVNDYKGCSYYNVHKSSGSSTSYDATCTTDAYIEDVCSLCGEEYVVTEENSALGHTEADPVVENLVVASCTDTGSYNSVVYCSVCGAELSRETITIDALGHDYDYDDIDWTWADDYSSATAIVTCANDSSHTLSYDATVTSEVVDATYTSAGSRTYTATVTINDVTYTDTKTETIAQLELVVADTTSITVETGEDGTLNITLESSVTSETEKISIPLATQSEDGTSSLTDATATTDSEDVTVEIDEDGNLVITPAENLASGDYTVTITITLSDGSTQDVVVTFTYDAQEEEITNYTVVDEDDDDDETTTTVATFSDTDESADTDTSDNTAMYIYALVGLTAACGAYYVARRRKES